MRDKKQQPHERVTTITTTQSNHHQLLSVQELILCGDTMQIDTPYLSTPVVQSPTTPGQFYMWNNADVSRSDVPPIQPQFFSCFSFFF